MNCAPGSTKQQKLFSDILNFVGQTSGLTASTSSENTMVISQTADGKSLELSAEDLEDVLLRSDAEGEDFIQVNFGDANKILITDSLVGFKPHPPKGLDASRLPRVVTTPDIINVFEAVQDALQASEPDPHEIAILKKVFDAVLLGGEAVGFDLSTERSWTARIYTSSTSLAS